MAQARGDYTRAFAEYERQLADPVRRSRAFARVTAKRLIPDSTRGMWALTRAAQLMSVLPTGVTRAIMRLNSKSVRVFDSMQFKDYSRV